MTDSDRQRLKEGMRCRAKIKPIEEVKDYYIQVCGQLKAQGRMSAEEYTECLRIIGKREQPTEVREQKTEQLELFV